jgi:hypothetical protein
MPHNVSEGTDHTTFLGRYAGKAGKDTHPARTGAAILHPSCRMHRNKAPRWTKRLWEPGGAACRQKMHMGKVCKGEKDSSVQEVFLSSCSASLRGPKRRFTIRKGASAFERTHAFLDSMPFSAESAQLRPFMVEGFLATL